MVMGEVQQSHDPRSRTGGGSPNGIHVAGELHAHTGQPAGCFLDGHGLGGAAAADKAEAEQCRDESCDDSLHEFAPNS